jgi:Predicted transcriptional regulator
MVRHTDMGISYAPFYVHSFPLIQPYFLVDAENFCLAYSGLSEIESTADKLRWCRHSKGLLQRDVADYAGIDRGTYVHYEDTTRDFYPLDKIEKLAELFEAPLEDLLDEYNLFLYRGQGRKIKAMRKAQGMRQQEFADLLSVPLSRLKAWEQEKVRMVKGSWERVVCSVTG